MVAGLTQHLDLELSNARCNSLRFWDVPHRRLTFSILAERERSFYPPIGFIPTAGGLDEYPATQATARIGVFDERMR
jgi:hypothetical protein